MPASRVALALALLVGLGALLGCRPEPAGLAIVPSEIAIAPGASALVHVIAHDASGAEVAASLERPLAIDVTWSATGAASVEARAQERAWRPEATVTVSGAAPGDGEIVATCCGGKTARAKVRVVAPAAPPAEPPAPAPPAPAPPAPAPPAPAPPAPAPPASPAPAAPPGAGSPTPATGAP